MAQSFAHGNYSHTQKRTQKARAGSGRTDRDRTRRVLSQNFLVDPDAVARLVKAAGPHDLVLEPGAGEGVLTRALAEICGQVVGYEVDPLLAGKLASRTRTDPRIRVVRGDFLAARAPREPFAVAGNIPYGITSKIVDWCLRAPSLTSATLLTQLEYARKRTGDFGRWSMLTVQTWPWYGWRLLDRIDAEAFRPVPAVDSAILRIDRLPHGPDLPGYEEFVAHGFTGLGGSLHATLLPRYPQARVDAAFAEAGVDAGTVVAYVHPDRWRIIFDHLHPAG
ncbi:ErmE/ErmH/ErmO/ErmR family 23S rRNA (adenine(2058)-N(6))-methyltransferase [Planobispora longispora]|uniref:23S rRNA (Adenine(2058)-N(6))-methyltransferase Erm(O) n=1 Tax=Planobispora longispora TaxID=28887 RepID=A0A8J3RNY1_9ACTN|nr:ErmE/ErmH/ErmO/ErmR family 23S rRNA (adenine(2058)-N(6))-methyltransferase [Planobispora longispora]GIH78443.1 23S rRNA (adenine(2058)-N(6))-methyltransferase Erm(O) [Planobispora longispora]